MTLDTKAGVKTRNTLINIERKQTYDAIRQLMSTNIGRRWMAEVLSWAHIGDVCFIPGAPDTTAFALGERNLGLRLQEQLMAASPEAYLLMLKEQGESSGRRATNDAGGTDSADGTESESA